MSRDNVISCFRVVVDQLFGADIDEGKREVLEHIISRVKDEEEHLRNQLTYRRLKELLRNSYLPGKIVEDIEGMGKILISCTE